MAVPSKFLVGSGISHLGVYSVYCKLALDLGLNTQKPDNSIQMLHPSLSQNFGSGPSQKRRIWPVPASQHLKIVNYIIRRARIRNSLKFRFLHCFILNHANDKVKKEIKKSPSKPKEAVLWIRNDLFRIQPWIFWVPDPDPSHIFYVSNLYLEIK